MIPWNWMWSPQWHFPFSGSVTQDITPDTRWFFGAIPPNAGVGSIEQKVFETASYGKQLGLILDVLVPLAERAGFASDEDSKALQKLRRVYAQIERVKDVHKEQMEESAIALMNKMLQTDPEMFERVIAKVKSTTSGAKQLPL